MKKTFLFIVATLALTACSGKWEYKIVTIENSNTSDFDAPEFKVSSEDFCLLGEDGWELVDVYTITETEHPNYGNTEYVTGIRDNTRTQSLNYVFKKRKLPIKAF